MTTVIFEAIRLTSRDTKEAIYIRHPNQALRCVFVPKDAILDMRKADKGYWSIEIPENLATEKDIF